MRTPSSSPSSLPFRSFLSALLESLLEYENPHLLPGALARAFAASSVLPDTSRSLSAAARWLTREVALRCGIGPLAHTAAWLEALLFDTTSVRHC